jgi:hypothetical protein
VTEVVDFLAASEFVEAIVGVGAARVRDLFSEAKENAPLGPELAVAARRQTTSQTAPPLATSQGAFWRYY